MEAKEFLENYQTANRQETRRIALMMLMALPDPPDIQGRRRKVYKFGGDKYRQPIMKMQLEHAYLQHRMMNSGREESKIVSLRRG